MSDDDTDPLKDYMLPPGRQWRLSALLAVGALLLVVLLGVAPRLFGSDKVEPAPPAPPPGTFRATPQQLKTFTIETVQPRAFVSEELTEGKIAVNADRSTPVLAPYSGRVTRVVAGLGETVRAGMPIAYVESSEYVQAQNDLQVALAQVNLARINENRKHALFDAKGGSQQDWQQAQADLASAESNLNAAHGKLSAFGLPERRIEQLSGKTKIEALAVVEAPISGVIVDRQIGPGQFLQPGATLATVADPASVWLLANVREADAGRVHPGQAIEVRVLAYPDRTFAARIAYVGAVLDPNTHRIPVRAVLDNHDGALKPEMFASFRILTSESAQAPAIPLAAVVYEGEAGHVWVVGADGVISYRRVTIGRTNAGWAEVLEGLQAGERIVTHGALFIDQAAVPTAS